ncbi:hypothetical protein IFR05_011517 [Cadophora sp. M221]|nr:hypothetical protein IFR05_011517 [Cadophora sp. M221]
MPGVEFVQVHIGEAGQVFSIHLDVISHDSTYFRDAFSRQHGIEGQTKIMILKDIEVKVFGMFNQWLYTKVIELSAQIESPEPGRNSILQQFINHAYSTTEYSVLQKLAVHKIMSYIPSIKDVKIWLEALPPGMQTDFTCEVVKNVSRLPKNLQFPQLKQSAIYEVALKTEVDLTE